jgi:hypothetical protein
MNQWCIRCQATFYWGYYNQGTVIIGKLLWKPLYMTYDSPLWTSEGLVIPEVASFKEEGLVTPEGWEVEKGNMKNCCSKEKLNPSLLHEMQECWPLHHRDIAVRWSRLKQSVLRNKSSHFTNPSLTQIEMIDIGHKSLPIIIGP